MFSRSPSKPFISKPTHGYHLTDTGLHEGVYQRLQVTYNIILGGSEAANGTLYSLSTHIIQLEQTKLLTDWKLLFSHVTAFPLHTRWRHQMETFSALLALCAGQWRRALMFSLICVWINDWVKNREAGDLRRHRGHYDVTVMCSQQKITSTHWPSDAIWQNRIGWTLA